LGCCSARLRISGGGEGEGGVGTDDEVDLDEDLSVKMDAEVVDRVLQRDPYLSLSFLTDLRVVASFWDFSSLSPYIITSPKSKVPTKLIHHVFFLLVLINYFSASSRIMIIIYGWVLVESLGGIKKQLSERGGEVRIGKGGA
jgi:hypothetical protein